MANLVITKPLLNKKSLIAAIVRDRLSYCRCKYKVGTANEYDEFSTLRRQKKKLQTLYEDYREKVGTMSKVVGGICTIDSVCPTKMACVGCGAKVPRPEFKEEITAFYNWADESEKRFEQLGLLLEAKKMKIAKNRAKNELKEIQLIEKSQKDETYAPEIRISSNK